MHFSEKSDDPNNYDLVTDEEDILQSVKEIDELMIKQRDHLLYQQA